MNIKTESENKADEERGPQNTVIEPPAPPSYQLLAAPPVPAKDNAIASGSSSQPVTTLAPPVRPFASSSRSLASSPSYSNLRDSLPNAPAKSKSPGSWFSFGERGKKAKSKAEAKAQILELVQESVKRYSTREEVIMMAESCIPPCELHGLSLSEIFQEKSMEGHSPLYWAIVARPGTFAAPGERADLWDTILALMLACRPLLPATIAEIKLACMITADQPLFQRIRHSGVLPMAESDKIILGGVEAKTDFVEVFDTKSDETSFAVNFEIPAFQTRMRASNETELVVEFIAKGRLWSISFTTPSKGVATVVMTLMDPSPPTYLDCRLIIPEPTPGHETIQATQAPFSSTSPALSLRLKARNELRPHEKHPSRGRIQAVLKESSLQYADTSYILPDGILRARLEARLAKPENDCVIC